MGAALCRWLKAPVKRNDGEIRQRNTGTPQEVLSPLLANLFLHYVFDRWIQKRYPTISFERYSDDIVVHCKTEVEAKDLLSQIAERFQACGLQLNAEKSKIVYCKDSNRRDNSLNISFDFLGYSFRPRKAINRKESICEFSPAVSKRAAKNAAPVEAMFASPASQ